MPGGSKLVFWGIMEASEINEIIFQMCAQWCAMKVKVVVAHAHVISKRGKRGLREDVINLPIRGSRYHGATSQLPSHYHGAMTATSQVPSPTQTAPIRNLDWPP